MTIKLIVARGENNEIGKGNDLLWSIPTDMEFFKKTTLNNTVVMGRKTWESIGSKPLKNRNNVIITNSGNRTEAINGQAVVFISLELFKELRVIMPGDIFIIGGAEIYREFAKLAEVMYITDVEQSYPEADTFLHEIDMEGFKSKPIYMGLENGLAFTIRKYERV